MKGFLFLAVAIVLETLATSTLKMTEQFTKLLPSIAVVLLYASSFYFLSLTLKTLPIGVAYGIWSGLGIVLVTIAGVFLFKEIPNTPTIIGLLLIIAGVVVINLFSKTGAH